MRCQVRSLKFKGIFQKTADYSPAVTSVISSGQVFIKCLLQAGCHADSLWDVRLLVQQ